MKQVYDKRDNVTDAVAFKAIGNRTCKNCGVDALSMPHREKHCSLVWRSGHSATKLPQALRDRGKQRVRDNADKLKQGQAAIFVVETFLVDLADAH